MDRIDWPIILDSYTDTRMPPFFKEVYCQVPYKHIKGRLIWRSFGKMRAIYYYQSPPSPPLWFFHFTNRDKRILCVGQQAQAMRTMSNGILTRLLQNNGKGSSALEFLGEMMCCWTSGCWFKLLVVGLACCCCWASQSRAFTRIQPQRTECFVVDF